MDDFKLLKLAETEGFSAALIPTGEIPVEPKFRAFCEENRCGRYNANYSCPPDCGTVEEMHRQILSEPMAMIFTSKWDIDSWQDTAGIQYAKERHNAGIRRLLGAVRRAGYEGFAAGYNGCQLCSPCKRAEHEPCPFPEQRISCMSAYCIDVAALSQKCGLEFAWETGRLYLFGMIAYHRI